MEFGRDLGIFGGLGAIFDVFGAVSAIFGVPGRWARRRRARRARAGGALGADRSCFWGIFGILTPFRPRFVQFDRGFAWDIFRGYFGDLNNCLALPR